ncbi:hypothetical protein MTO96_044508 [Rhipicephalus appendiculatus]
MLVNRRRPHCIKRFSIQRTTTTLSARKNVAKKIKEAFMMRKLFRLVILGTAVCTVLLHFVLFRKSKPHRGAVLILRGAQHPYIRRPIAARYAGRHSSRRRSTSAMTSQGRDVTFRAAFKNSIKTKVGT